MAAATIRGRRQNGGSASETTSRAVIHNLPWRRASWLGSADREPTRGRESRRLYACNRIPARSSRKAARSGRSADAMPETSSNMTTRADLPLVVSAVSISTPPRAGQRMPISRAGVPLIVIAWLISGAAGHGSWAAVRVIAVAYATGLAGCGTANAHAATCLSAEGVHRARRAYPVPVLVQLRGPVGRECHGIAVKPGPEHVDPRRHAGMRGARLRCGCTK